MDNKVHVMKGLQARSWTHTTLGRQWETCLERHLNKLLDVAPEEKACFFSLNQGLPGNRRDWATPRARGDLFWVPKEFLVLLDVIVPV